MPTLPVGEDERGEMTIDTLQRIACKLSNSGWCRYWVNWNGSGKMAIQVVDHENKPQRISDADGNGLTENPDYVYTAQRTDEFGEPYKSWLDGWN